MMVPNLFPEEQQNIPGLETAGTKIRGKRPIIRSESASQLPLLAAVRDLPEWRPAPPIPGQLAFNGPNQMELEKMPAQPVQLGLLPEPPPWELPDEPAAPKAPRGPARRRRKPRISPGQTSLF